MKCMLKMKLFDKIAVMAVWLMVMIASVFEMSAEGRSFRKVISDDYAAISQATVYDIKRTGSGFTWIATDQGLMRFDGEHVIKVPLSYGDKKSKAVKSLAAMTGGDLLIGTDSHIFRLTSDGNSYKTEPLLGGMPFQATCGITSASGDAILGGDDGVVIFSPDSNQAVHLRMSGNILNLQNKVIDIAQAPNSIYVLTKGGIFKLDKDSRSAVPVISKFEVENLSPMSLEYAAGCLFIGTSGDGVLSLDLTNGKVENTNYSDPGYVVTSLDLSSDGKLLFIGTDGGGVVKVDLATGRKKLIRHSISEQNGPTSNQVYSILYDSQGLLWIGYYQNGLDFTPVSNGPFELYDNPDSFNSRGVPVRALCLNDSFTAVGTREGVVVMFKDSGDVWNVASPLLRSEMVISLLAHSGKIYVGTYGGGMQVLDPVSRSVTDFIPSVGCQVFRNGHVFSLYADNDNGIWAGTNDGLYRFDVSGDKKHFTSYQTALPEGNVYGIFFDSEGKGWICTDSGVCIYDPEHKMLRTDLFPVSFPKSTRFRSVYEDTKRHLYFVPESGYVYSCGLDFSNPRFFDFPILHGSDAKSVVEDSFGDIWISTNRGVFRTDSSGHTIRFGLAAGLPSVSFLQAQPISDKDGNIWFGNAEGLLSLDESSIESSIGRHSLPVPTKVAVNGQSTYIIPAVDDNGCYIISLDGNANNLRLGFSTFSYAVEEPEAYEYQLDNGLWIKFTNGMYVSLYDLKHGKHRLNVRSADDSDSSSAGETSVIIDVPYPFTWKLGLCVIVALMFLSAWITYRTLINKFGRDRVKQGSDDEAVQVSGEYSDTPIKKYVSNTMTRSEARDIACRVDEVMNKQKPYLQSDLKVAMLAEMVGISSHKLSQFFSQHKDVSFYDYVNKYRVEEFKRMVREDNVGNYTLSAMAEKAGFSSRASFFRYFKNIEGISPGEYLKNPHKK